MGHLTRDPVLRLALNGCYICQFSVAMSRHFRSKAGEKQKEMTFVNVVSLDRLAITVSKQFLKGSPIFVEGSLESRQIMDKTSANQRNSLAVLMKRCEYAESLSIESDPAQQAQQATFPITANL